MRVSKQVSFNEEEIREWCERSGEDNEIHLDEESIDGNQFFDERVVPGMMLLDQVSGVITKWSRVQYNDVTPVVSRMSSVIFDEPVYFNEEVQVAVEQEEEGAEEMYILRFEITDSVAADPRIQGYATVYLL